MVQMTLVRLTPDDPSHWVLMGETLRRMARFVALLELDTPIDTMLQYVRTHWAANSPTVALWVMIHQGGIVAHALAVLESAWGVPYGMVVQVQVNHGIHMGRADRLAFLEAVEAWARSQGATSLKMLTPHLPKVWQRLAGFTFDKYLLKKPIEAQ